MLRGYLRILILTWGAESSRRTLVGDVTMAGIVTIALILHSLANAEIAGLLVRVPLGAPMAPLILHALFGTSRTLAVGPVAVVSRVTAPAVAPLAVQGTPEYLGAAGRHPQGTGRGVRRQPPCGVRSRLQDTHKR